MSERKETNTVEEREILEKQMDEVRGMLEELGIQSRISEDIRSVKGLRRLIYEERTGLVNVDGDDVLEALKACVHGENSFQYLKGTPESLAGHTRQNGAYPAKMVLLEGEMPFQRVAELLEGCFTSEENLLFAVYSGRDLEEGEVAASIWN